MSSSSPQKSKDNSLLGEFISHPVVVGIAELFFLYNAIVKKDNTTITLLILSVVFFSLELIFKRTFPDYEDSFLYKMTHVMFVIIFILIFGMYIINMIGATVTF